MNPSICAFTIFFDFSRFLPISRRGYRHPNLKTGGFSRSRFGHVMIALTDPFGNERFYGYTAKQQVAGRNNVPPEDRISLRDLNRPVAAQLNDESHRSYARAIRFSLTEEQWRRMNAFVMSWINRQPKYQVKTNSCVHFVRDVARAGDIALLPKGAKTPVTPGKLLKAIRKRQREVFEASERNRIRMIGALERKDKPFPPAP
ncbi:MAG: hypothetical protein U9N14_03665 [Pseudomonadota bacterium]|nr:hypothetical protein [Pseudomonadota bacterium]